MNFDIFNNINVKEEYNESIINYSKEAERNIFIKPYDALISARKSLESLLKAIVKQRGYKYTKNQSGDIDLFEAIRVCVDNGVFTNRNKVDIVRKNGNDCVHKDNPLYIVNEANVNKAIQSVKSLFEIFVEVFSELANGATFNINKIPFGDYEIVRAVKKGENEVIYGDYNYFVKDHEDNYYYFQILKKEQLGKRSILVANQIKKDKKRKSYQIEAFYPYDLKPESDRSYIAYPVYSDSQLLSEIKPGTLTEKQIVQIGLDLLNILIELKKVGDGISLRNIQPCNIIVTPDGDDYMANVVNMETAKINNYNITVFGNMGNLLDSNYFLPEVVRNCKEEEKDKINWEKVDIYSIAVVMVYCKNSSYVKKNIDTDDLYDDFSDEVVEILGGIFNSSINEILEIEEIKTRLENALSEL